MRVIKINEKKLNNTEDVLTTTIIIMMIDFNSTYLYIHAYIQQMLCRVLKITNIIYYLFGLFIFFFFGIGIIIDNNQALYTKNISKINKMHKNSSMKITIKYM